MPSRDELIPPYHFKTVGENLLPSPPSSLEGFSSPSSSIGSPRSILSTPFSIQPFGISQISHSCRVSKQSPSMELSFQKLRLTVTSFRLNPVFALSNTYWFVPPPQLSDREVGFDLSSFASVLLRFFLSQVSFSDIFQGEFGVSGIMTGVRFVSWIYPAGPNGEEGREAKGNGLFDAS